jgi:geranyl-CoA carboxylase alpha subunit
MPNKTPFTKLLVANRGEIAMRVMRTAKAMGYATVAVHSTADARARHVLTADESVCIGDPLPADSYLRIDRIIEAARRTGADAIHPGYGFLAENEDFAQACIDAGIVFVGPSPQAIRAMGHKAGAKRLMMEAGVPCIPGYQGEQQDEASLQAQARRVGFPLMIKATAGGGGRGMRLARQPEEFAELLRSAKSEARGAFGDDEVLLERAIVEPRHIEIQVVADRHGNAIYLGERDCSVQRRHQKVIEEAPSPVVGTELRERMGAAAVQAAKAIGYEGAGTLEFLLDPEGNFYFMEMNTRLQVEHPVTEAITGLDLVELQLRAAGGEPLPLRQQDVRLQGHAIEVRLCAEEPASGFMPQSGCMALWRPSTALRVEHGLDSGAEIPPFYDSMVAKLIAHGRDREEARRRLLHGLADTVALGVATNQAFLSACLRHPEFAEGGATTAFIGRHKEQLLASEPRPAQEALALAAALLYADGRGAVPHSFMAPLRLRLGGGEPMTVIAVQAAGGFEVRIGQEQFQLQLLELGNHDVRFTCNGIGRGAVFHRDGASLGLHYLGRPWQVEDLTRQAAKRHSAAGGDGRLRASMNGRVVAVTVLAGDLVAAGQAIVTLEAMKMEHAHVAPIAGRVAALNVGVGDQVGAHRVIAEIEPIGA